MRISRSASQRNSAFALLLVAALLFAHWAGLMHRIEHAHLWQGFVQAAADDDEKADAKHSCIAFDAAAVADTIHLPPFVAPLLASPRVLALWVAFSSWKAPLALHFSSRAPPLAG
jgi:hypothetical protein